VGGLGTYVTCHISEFFSFSFSVFAFHITHIGHIFTDLDYLYAIKHVSVQACAFWDLGNYPKKLPQMGENNDF